MQLKRQDVIDACGDQAFSRGLDYFAKSRVLFLEAEGISDESELKLKAKTKGGAHRIYEQNIVLRADYGFIDVDGYCSCPMHYNCKHIAAVCLCYEKNQHQLSSVHRKQNLHENKGQLSPEITHWLNSLHLTTHETSGTSETGSTEFPVYMQTQWKNEAKAVHVDIRLTHSRKSGNGLVKGRLTSPDQLCSAYHHQSCRIQQIDRDIGRCLKTLHPNLYSYNAESVLEGRSGAIALNLMLETERCFLTDLQHPPLAKGPDLSIEFRWIPAESGELCLRTLDTEDLILLPTIPAMYIDSQSGKVGMMESSEWHQQQIPMLLQAPTIPAEFAPLLNTTLLESFPDLPLPPPVAMKVKENSGEKITPRLTLGSVEISNKRMHCLFLDFDYDGDRVLPYPVETLTRLSTKNQRIHVKRSKERETQSIQRLIDMGFTLQPPIPSKRQPHTLLPIGNTPTQEDIHTWSSFLEKEVDILESDGWQINYSDNFRLQFDDGDWEIPIHEEDSEEGNGNDWFSLRFDLTVNDERLPLGPLLAPILSSDIHKLPEILTLPLGDHRYVRLPKSRILPFVDTLNELFNRTPKNALDQPLTLSRYDALAINRLGGRVRGGEYLRGLAEKLENFSGIKTIPLPDKFNANLRPYQHIGLNWLQFLREYRFNGILADDMGLGKTIQTLAHLLVEKQEGRFTAPALVIAPTSLMGNWRREIERFTPALSVMVLHGNDRHQKFRHIKAYDIILSTYPLLSRDAERLMQVHYHSIILDEAQMIKNPNTKMSKLVRQLSADHRLCLSGTPLENHLGELWSLFDFLMPGFLGTQDQFSRFYRTPIEKHGDMDRRKSLSERVRPFLLRRRKSEVAKELPPKTEMLLNIELHTEQAEIYESIRVSMDKRVRDAISSQGLAKSHITILDALLKLRQVCCDPRLVRLQRSMTNQRSAKLDMLMRILPEQLKEGRRILIFSQFTSMLELIGQALIEEGMSYTKLTGQTRKRDEAIQKFQEGQVDLFLISLKAGGTGLNLTEADTVIIYDPWWNPAVENQAIDRAHRIGQDKPVFIYKLVVENSVEEKMIAMQKKKQRLAEGVYSGSLSSSTLFTTESIQDLFAPLSDKLLAD